MASKQKYECFRCRDNGYPSTMVYLAGKDEQGKTIYVEEDGIGHIHKIRQQQPQSRQPQSQQQQQQQQSTDSINPMPLLRLMDAKMDRIIALLSNMDSAENNV